MTDELICIDHEDERGFESVCFWKSSIARIYRSYDKKKGHVRTLDVNLGSGVATYGLSEKQFDHVCYKLGLQTHLSNQSQSNITMTEINRLNFKHDHFLNMMDQRQREAESNSECGWTDDSNVALSELQHMYADFGCNPFADSRVFSEACGQEPSMKTAKLYMELIREEFEETLGGFYDLVYAKEKGSFATRQNQLEEELRATVETADGCIDLIKVTMGLLEALGLRGEELWKEVHRSNMSKVREDGTVERRADGKILKPESYSPPDLLTIVTKQLSG